MSKKIRDKWNMVVNWLQQNALAILGLSCFLYAQFGSSFAEWHIKLWFLNFPIFIGEILLAFYIILFIKRYASGIIQFRRWHILLLLYVTFILCKAFYGYAKWGALAFRNAALFYNTLFIIISYYVFNERLEKSKFLYVMAMVIFGIAVYLYPPWSYFTYTYLMLTFVLFLYLIPAKKVRHLMMTLFLITFPYKLLFAACRAEVVSTTFACLLLLSSLFLVLQLRLIYKIIVYIASLVILGLFSYIYVEKSDLRSLFLPRYTINQYNYYARLIDARKDEFGQMRDMKVLVYDNNKTGLYASPEKRREMAAKAAREAERIAKREAKRATKKAEALTLKARKQQKEAEAAVVLIQQKTAEEVAVVALRQQKEAEEAAKEEAKPIELAKAEEVKEPAETETVAQTEPKTEPEISKIEAAKQHETAGEIVKPVEIPKVETAEQEIKPIVIAKLEQANQPTDETVVATTIEPEITKLEFPKQQVVVEEIAKPAEITPIEIPKVEVAMQEAEEVAKAEEAREPVETETVAKAGLKTDQEITKIEAPKPQEPTEEIAKPIEIDTAETAQQDPQPIEIEVAKAEEVKEAIEVVAQSEPKTEPEITQIVAFKPQEALEEIVKPVEIIQEEAIKEEAIPIEIAQPSEFTQEAAKEIEVARHKAEAIKLAALKMQKAAEEARNEAETAMRKAEEIARKEAEEETRWIQETELRKAGEAKLTAKNAVLVEAQRKSKDYIDANITWRIFVWKDMCAELVEGIFKSRWGIFGIDFGKPFRSKSIEVLEWSMGGWVGWIEPHNSYLHILYRAGIIGFLFIIIVWSLFVGMFVLFIKIRDIKGILSCSALSYWFSVSNFAVILELPYFAIPFWSLFGATLAYYHKAKEVRK